MQPLCDTPLANHVTGFLLEFLKCYGTFIIIRPIRVYLRQTGTVILAMSVASLVYAAWLPKYCPTIETSGLGNFALAAFQQLVIGCLIGFPFALAVETLPMIGRLADVIRGSQYADQVAPGAEPRTSLFEGVGLYLSAMLLFLGGGYQVLIGGLFASSGRLSDRKWEFSALLNLSWERVFHFAGEIFELVILSVAPLIVLVLLVEFGLLAYSRALQRVQVSTELNVVKLLAGVAIAVGIFAHSPRLLGDLFERAAVLQQTWFQGKSV